MNAADVVGYALDGDSYWRDESGAITDKEWEDLCSELDWDFICVCEGE